MTTYEAATKLATEYGHWVLPVDWHHDSPTPGRAWTRCRDCAGTIEIREDGTVAWPGTRPTCAGLERALAEQREGISDYYAQGSWEVDDEPWP